MLEIAVNPALTVVIDANSRGDGKLLFTYGQNITHTRTLTNWRTTEEDGAILEIIREGNQLTLYRNVRHYMGRITVE